MRVWWEGVNSESCFVSHHTTSVMVEVERAHQRLFYPLQLLGDGAHPTPLCLWLRAALRQQMLRDGARSFLRPCI